jgi:hypothetical protein
LKSFRFPSSGWLVQVERLSDPIKQSGLPRQIITIPVQQLPTQLPSWRWPDLNWIVIFVPADFAVVACKLQITISGSKLPEC